MLMRLSVFMLGVFFGMSFNVAQANDGQAITRIDHIMIEHKAAGDSFTLFAKQFGMPIIWPMAKYGLFSSGGLYFGNVVIEFGTFSPNPNAVPTVPKLAGIAFTPPKSAADSIAELKLRQIAHGPAEPFNTMRDGKPLTLWTNVLINGIGPSDAWLFVCDYSFDTKPREASARDQLLKLDGGPLGLVGVKEIVVETSDLQSSIAKWKNLLSSATETESGNFVLASGPTIRLVAGKSEALRVLTIEVSSLAKAVAALTAENAAHGNNGAEVTLSGGLPFRLVQRN